MHEIVTEDIEDLLARPGLELEKLKASTVLVAGGTSMIGKYLVWLLCALNEKRGYGITLYVLVRNLVKAEKVFSGQKEKPYFHFVHQDICEPIDFAAVGRAVSSKAIPAIPVPDKIDYIFHFAAAASARLIAEDPVGVIKANTIGTVNVLECAHTFGAQVVFASTREVYGSLPDDVVRVKEDDMGTLDPLHPRNSYPESKKMAEALLVAYAQQFGVPFTILRIAHSYGPGMEISRDGRIMSDIIGALVRKEDVVLNSDGTARRGFCYISDCIDGILRATFSASAASSATASSPALPSAGSGVFNLANETEPKMIRDVAQILVDDFPELGLKVVFANTGEKVAGQVRDDERVPRNPAATPTTEAFKGGYNPIPLVQLDTSRIEATGWRPQIALEEGMRRTVLSFR